MDDSFLQMEVQILRVVDSNQEEIGQGAGLLYGGIALRCRKISLSITVNFAL